MVDAKSRWFRFNLWLHRWASLIVTIPFFILCVSGTVLIFHEEIDEALGIVPPAPGHSDGKQSLNRAVEKVLSAYPEEKVAIIGIDPDDHPGLLLIGTVPNADSGFNNLTRRFSYLASGESAQEKGSTDVRLTEFLFELHAQWFLGTPGALLGALFALLVLISLLSGIIVYWPYVRRVAFGIFRKRKPRLYQLDLHNFIGVTVTAWLFVVSLTGFFLGFGTLLTGLWAQSQLKGSELETRAELNVRRPQVSADQAYHAALSAAPEGWRVEVIIWPGTDFSSTQNYAVRIVGSGLNKKLFRVVLVDSLSGAVLKTVELPWYMKTIALSQPLHFGDYGGTALKVLWTVFAWLTLFITANGAWLWWARRRGRSSMVREGGVTA